MMRRKLVVGAVVWSVLCILLLGGAVGVLWADECSGTCSACLDKPWYDTCCARGCTVTMWDMFNFEIVEQFEFYPTPWSARCCKEVKYTALSYSCPTQDPPCTRTVWYWLDGPC